ncbi:protein kinase family protein [Micromonospora sp. NBC_01699]|uniref:protein kinase family protein n=1 Tax=Micromonospora sp. NBC_01699 TaxID=2975984 RepID=UPI002E2D7350|nr:protein kinase family protein [Micromonospora sp. NBC_01699]
MPSSTGPSIATIIEGGRVTQVGEGQEADEVAPPVMAFGAPAVGEVLAERYELAEHINDDSAGRQVWRGVDVVLRRPVAVVLRYPGGDSAMEMLQAAVTASRVIHPNLVGVYDAIDEDERAYVVREWVDGHSLRELVADGPLEPARATSIAHAVAGAIAAVHATGMVHGNVHPGTVMVGDDGRVVLADARADGNDTIETDARAVGGVLYFALTGAWPHVEANLSGGRGRSALPDGVRDANGALAAPRQVRAGVPAYLDDLTMDLLDPQLAVPSVDVLAAELGRLNAAAEEQYLDNSGPLRFTSHDEENIGAPAAPAGARKIVAGVAGLLVIALIGLYFGINALSDNGGTGTASPATPPGATAPAGGTDAPTTQPKKIPIDGSSVRIVSTGTDRGDELNGAAAVVDGDVNKGWESDSYDGPKFANLKTGMGVLIDLKEPRAIKDVQVTLANTGATAELKTGTTTLPSSKASDTQLVTSYQIIGEPFERAGSVMTFSAFESEKKYQYLLFWVTDIIKNAKGDYRLGIQEITVREP